TTTVLRQRQPSVQESLSPQQLREWVIWWGSPSGGASHARAGGAGAGGPCTRRREPLSSQQLRKRAVLAAGRRGGSGGGQQRQQRPPETLSPQQLREWAVRWGSPGGGAWGTSAGGGEAPGGVEATSLGAVDLASTVIPLTVPVLVTLADPFGGLVVARGATVLPCPAAPSGLLTGLHLPSFAKNLVATSVLQDLWVTVTQPGGELVAICTDSRTGEHLATLTRRPGSGLYTLTTKSALVAESGQVAVSVEVVSSCSCRLLTHQTLLWHHRLGHPSLPRLRGMHSRLLVSGLPRSLPPLPRSLAPPCLPCVEGRQRATPHSSFPPTTAPLQTLYMDLRARFQQDLLVLRLHSDRGGEFFSHLLEDFCGAEGIIQSYTLPASPRHNGIAKRRIGLVMEVAHTSMIHVAAPHFLWPFAVRYAAEQLNLWPRVSHPETSPTLRWTGEVGDASAFRIWGSLSLVRDLPASKLSPCTLRPSDSTVFTPTAVPRCPSRLSPSWTTPPPGSPPHPPGPAPSGVSQVDPAPLVEPLEVSSDTSGTAEGGDPTPAAIVTPRRSARLAVPPGFQPRPSSPPLQPDAVDSGAARGGTTGGAGSGGAGSGGAECPLGTGGTGGIGASGPATRRQEILSPEWLREWAVQWGSPGGGASRARSPRARGTGGAAAVGTVAGSPGGGGGRAGAAGTRGIGAVGGAGYGGASPGGAGAIVLGTGGTEAAGGAGGSRGASLGGARAGVPGTGGTGAAGGARGAAGGAGGAGTAGGAGGAGTAGGAGGATRGTAGGTGVSGAHRQAVSRLLLLSSQFLALLPRYCFHQLTSLSDSYCMAPRCPLPLLTLRASVPDRVRRVRRPRAPAVLGTHDMTLRPSSVPQRVVLPLPPASSLPHVPDPESDLVRAAGPTVTPLLATAVTDPSFESAAASALVTELVDFAALCRLDYAASLVFYSSCPLSVRGELALGSDVLEDKQFELECLAAAAPRLASTLLCPEGDLDAPDISTPRTYAEAITGPYSSQWQIAMDAEMASWKSTGTYVDEVPPPRANTVDGMWTFRVKQPPGSPPAFKAHCAARGFSQREGVDLFQTFSPTPKMTTLRVLLHVAAQRDYELHSLDFSTAFLQGSLHEAIWLRRPRGFTGSFPEGTQWSLRQPVYGL
ncbi:unnamed protein product, partial [Closterium sp. NIES-53]